MNNVRAFKRDDIPEVAELYAQVFLHDQTADFQSLRSHFKDVYFDHPFQDDDCPSLVYLDSKGSIAAFLGVMPRRMRFKGDTIKAAITGNLMVKGEAADSPRNGHAPAHGNQLAPAALVKAFFRAPQDLSLADSAIDASYRIWSRSGGHGVQLYSLRWLCILKAFSYGLDSLERRNRFPSLVRLSRPAGKLLDNIAKPFVASNVTALPPGCVIEQLHPEDMVEAFDACRRYDLLPVYSAESMDWILRMARSRKYYGSLKNIAVRQADGHLLGWAIYAVCPGETGHTLQLYADRMSFDRVFDCLVHDAAKNGVTALGGKADPMLIDRFSTRKCLLTFNVWTLVRARRPELLQAFLTGKVFFSELESEGWTRFVHARAKQEFAQNN